MLTPLQARINIRTLYANGDITKEEMDNIDTMLTSSDKDNHTIAMGIIAFKKKEKDRKQIHFINGSTTIDIMEIDPEYLLEISHMATCQDRDKVFAMYLNLVPMSKEEQTGLMEMLDSNDQESTYLAEQIIISKIREIQNSRYAGDNTIS